MKKYYIIKEINMYIEDDGFSNAYKKMCLYLLKNGEKSCPRNMGTQEVEGAMIRVKIPELE